MAHKIFTNPRRADLPLDLIEDILCRLTVKPLKRLRCVSKSWCSLIDSDGFIKSHLNWSVAKNHRRHLLYPYPYPYSKSGVYTLNLDMAEEGEYNNLVLPFSNNRNNRIDIGILNIHSSCNGLVFLQTYHPVLWNPFTREYKVLPGPRYKQFYNNAYAFWYDSINDDYKVLRITKKPGADIFSRTITLVDIYSLKSNSWTDLTDFPSSMNEMTSFVYSNGALHTIFGGILAYNVDSKEHYEVIMPPGELQSSWSSTEIGQLELVVIGGCLGLTHYSKDFYFAIWVMKDYGVNESWFKLLLIDPFEFTPIVYNVSLLGYSRDGTKVLLNQVHDRLVSYELPNTTEQKRSHTITCLHYKLSHNGYCIESLVSLNTMQENSHNRKKRKRRRCLRLMNGNNLARICAD